MAVHQQCVPTAVQEEGEQVSKKREGTDGEFSESSSPLPALSLRKELVNIVLQELALFQVHVATPILIVALINMPHLLRNLEVVWGISLFALLLAIFLTAMPVAFLLLVVPSAVLLLQAPSIALLLVLPVVVILLLVPIAVFLLAVLAITLVMFLIPFVFLPLVIEVLLVGVSIAWYMGVLRFLRLLGVSSLGLELYDMGSPTYLSSLVITTITIPLLFALDWKLISTMDISKHPEGESEDGIIQRKLKKWKILVRWLGHIILVFSSSYVVFKLFNDPEEMHKYAYFITLHLFTGILTKTFIDSVKSEPDKILVSNLRTLKWIPWNEAADRVAMKWFAVKETGMNYVTFHWIPMKWIVTLEFAYLPSICSRIIINVFSPAGCKDFSLLVPLMEAAILTVCTADYKEMRWRRGVRDVIVGAAKLAIVGMFLHYCLYDRTLAELVRVDCTVS